MIPKNMVNKIFDFNVIVVLAVAMISFTKNNISYANLASTKPVSNTQSRLVKSARRQIGVTTNYNPAYVKISYPMGDVPLQTGVCTDVVIRAYRGIGVDLQKLVHEDMRRAWKQYPKLWGLKKTDKNIDHRRVPNLQVYFKRHGQSLQVSKNPNSYKTGDLVTWLVNGKLPHIGIVSNRNSINGVPFIIHNIGNGTLEQNVLFRYKITGHYRF